MTYQAAAAKDVLEKPKINLYRPAMLINCGYRLRFDIKTVCGYINYLSLPWPASSTRARWTVFGIAFDCNDANIFELCFSRFAAEFNGPVKNDSFFNGFGG